MRTQLCDRFGIQYPIFVFTPSEKVAAAVSRAGGMGVLGCVWFNQPDELEAALCWMDENAGGNPYGVDVVMPAKVPTEGTAIDIDKLVPQQHRDFVAKTLLDLGCRRCPTTRRVAKAPLGWLHSIARSHVEVALNHPISLIANALGSPPADVIEEVHAAGVPVAALAGSAKHAQRHVDNGVDIVVAQGHEAGGTPARSVRWCCGRKSLTPWAVGLRCSPRAGSEPAGRWRPPGAGASGVWMGSAFLTAAEYDLGVRAGDGPSVIQEALLAATSSDTVRRRIYSGKPARLLKSRWTDAWDAAGAPIHCRCRCRTCSSARAHQRMSRSTDPTAVAMPVGQILGRMNEIRPAADIIADLVAGFEEATRALDGIRDS